MFEHSPWLLYQYHLKVIAEMVKRGYEVTSAWLFWSYRGKNCNPLIKNKIEKHGETIYAEHNNQYLNECLNNLKQKGIILEV